MNHGGALIGDEKSTAWYVVANFQSTTLAHGDAHASSQGLFSKRFLVTLFVFFENICEWKSMLKYV